MSVQKSRGYRLNILTRFEIAEATTTEDVVKEKIRHYKKGLLHVINRLDEKEKELDEMIRTGVIPYGKTFK